MLLARRGRALRFEGEGAALVRAVLDALSRERSLEGLVEEIASRAPETAPELVQSSVAALVAALVRHGVVTELPAPGRALRAQRRVLVAITGAVAAIDAPALVRGLLALGHAVRVIVTRSGRRFVTARALEALTHSAVHASLWSGRAASPAPHIELARWAEVMVVYPCSASTLARLAAGDASELLSATAIATSATLVVAPSMNASMWSSAAVQENVATLRERGVITVHPGMGEEVADAPSLRRAMPGPAPAPEVMRELLDAIIESLPRSATDWTQRYEGRGARPWEVDADPELQLMLAGHAPVATHPRLVDVGCGLGALARRCASLGYRVTATDLAATAIERACGQRGSEEVTWIVDDVRRSLLRGRFDVVLDRGCFHSLDALGREVYVEQVRRWLRVGGLWIAKVHAEGGGDLGTARFTLDRLDEALGAGFERVEGRPCEFGGVVEPALAVAYRRLEVSRG